MSQPTNLSQNLRAAALLIVLAVGTVNAGAQSSAMPAYQPREKISDTIRNWGSTEMAGVLRGWERGFLKFHPDARFADTLKGSDTAQAALYADVADLGLMDR